MGLTVRPYLAIINLSVATGFRTPILFGRLPTGSLYSLEKLIEWKLGQSPLCHLLGCSQKSLYSLEKLIEWKLDVGLSRGDHFFSNSLLAREIN